ncbi:hypothetical protein DMC01_04055 [Campylobacter troglodytis]|nr:hypothetical protein DMC01_04055 [Campylobacter troglodytis]
MLVLANTSFKRKRDKMKKTFLDLKYKKFTQKGFICIFNIDQNLKAKITPPPHISTQFQKFFLVALFLSNFFLSKTTKPLKFTRLYFCLNTQILSTYLLSRLQSIFCIKAQKYFKIFYTLQPSYPFFCFQSAQTDKFTRRKL